MSRIKEVIEQIRATPGCTVLPPSGLPVLRPMGPPVIQEPQVLPADLREFYRLCSGVLFHENLFHYDILPPDRVEVANPILLLSGITMSEEVLLTGADDISWSWYLIAADDSSQYVTIDLSVKRLGRCYDSFLGSHAMPGYCPIVARSFTELLTRFYEYYEHGGEGGYWEEPDFVSLGDAYDDVVGSCPLDRAHYFRVLSSQVPSQPLRDEGWEHLQ